MRIMFVFLMIRRPPRSTRTDTHFPYTTLFRSGRPEAESARILRESLLFLSFGYPEGFSLPPAEAMRSEEHTSELQSLLRISYAVFCLKKKNKPHTRAQP